MSPRTPGKRQTLLDFLQRGIAMVHLDARRPGVVVPPQFADDPHLRLNLSYRYGIPDLDVGEERVLATLSFGGRPFRCLLPWSAVFGVTSHTTGDGQVWPDDLPDEVVRSISAESEDDGVQTPSRGTRPALKAVVTEAAPEEKAQKADPAGAKKPHLRLVR